MFNYQTISINDYLYFLCTETEGRGCDSDTDCLGDGNSKSICVKAIPSSRRSLLFTKVLEDKVKAKEGICSKFSLLCTPYTLGL